MRGSGDGNTQTSFDKATDHGVWLIPFLSQNGGESPGEESCLSSEHSVGGNNERGKMAALLEAGLEVFPLFLPVVLCKNLFRILVMLGLCIGVRDSNIDNAVRSMRPKTTDKNVSTVVADK